MQEQRAARVWCRDSLTCNTRRFVRGFKTLNFSFPPLSSGFDGVVEFKDDNLDTLHDML